MNKYDVINTFDAIVVKEHIHNIFPLFHVTSLNFDKPVGKGFILEMCSAYVYYNWLTGK